MALRFEIELALGGNYQKWRIETQQRLARAAMGTGRDMAKLGRTVLQRSVVRAGLGRRLSKSWRSKVYPDSGYAIGPAVLFYSKARKLIDAFNRGVTIRSKAGKFLAIPTENAPKSSRTFDSARGINRRGRQNLVAAAEARHGPLRYIPIKGRRLGLLVADKQRRRRGKRKGFAPASKTALKRGDFENSVPMFWLVPQAKLKRRLNVKRDFDRLAQQLPRRAVANFNRRLRRERLRE